MTEPTIDSILDLLNEHRQRATYGAVAKVVNKPPTFLMAGRSRDQRHSWIVNRRSGMPTGYEPAQVHPDLSTNPMVIESSEALAAWLREAVEAPVTHGN